MNGFWNYLSANWSAILPWAYMMVTAIVVTMPAPGTKLDSQAMYGWFYDAVHQFANLRSQRPTYPSDENPSPGIPPNLPAAERPAPANQKQQ